MMGRKSSGLRNRFRTSRSTYSIKHKRRNKDHYGSYTAGVMRAPESIAGTTISAQLVSQPKRPGLYGWGKGE